MTAATLAKIRAAAGLTQAELAEKLGVHLRTVQKWEGNERAIPEPIVKLLAILFPPAPPPPKKGRKPK